MLLVNQNNIFEMIIEACRRIGRPPKPIRHHDLATRDLFEEKFDRLSREAIESIKEALWQIIEFYLNSTVKEFFRKRPRSRINILTGEHPYIDGNGVLYCSFHYISMRPEGIYWVKNWGFEELVLPQDKGDLAQMMLHPNPLIKAMIGDLVVLLSWTQDFFTNLVVNQINRRTRLKKKEKIKQ